MGKYRLLFFLLLLLLVRVGGYGQSLVSFFDHTYKIIGRGLCANQDKQLKTKDAYALFGDSTWVNYEASFSARVPENASEVQICTGFRVLNRDDRYILLLRGGIQKHLYLARLGYMGTDDFLALRTLNFQPTPGVWYKFRIQVVKNRIRIFLNDEKLPRIDVNDKFSSFAPSGGVTLGGSWIENNFRDFAVKSLSADALNDVPSTEFQLPAPDKEAERKAQRAAYRPIQINGSLVDRTEISLNGNWLFKPGYEVNDQQNAASAGTGDEDWHVMHVPDFWNPLHIWQHGEAYNGSSKGVSDNYWEKEKARCAAYTFDYRKTNVGWYRQWLTLPNTIKGKNLELSFDAVSKVAEVWINGKKAGSHIGMFGDFKINATPYLKPGKNLVAVKVLRDFVKDIKDPNKIAGVAVTVEVTEKMVKDLAHGFFDDDPAGIWQPVKLTITNPLRISDVFIKPNLTGADLEVTVSNTGNRAQQFDILSGISGYKLKGELYSGRPLQKLKLAKGEQQTFAFHLTDLKPRLWSPEHPELYNFSFSIAATGSNQVIDRTVIRSGFRTFKSLDGYLYLNGKRYWLRGGNQTAMPLAPNDTALAEKWCRLMREGNMDVTRTHTAPYTETWMDASDRFGIGISYEGTWPWLFLESSVPDPQLIPLWKNEFLDLLRKYRNHPSLIFWTMNNEMKFYDNDPDIERAKWKMKVISDVVKEMRQVDPTRPVVFDSNYRRNTKRFGAEFYKDIDDGDIDDPHAYYNWYDYSMFQFFKGEWQKQFKNEGRPLISQEMSTGYTDETGHPSRYYTYVHQNPESFAGKYVYEYNNPYYFLTTQSFVSKELAEALRRTNDKASGIIHFSALTWFRNVYKADSIQPFPVYYQMKKALQPVLVSAELWGRHFYAGRPLTTRICVINDREDGSLLPSTELQWQLVDQQGKAFANGKLDIPPVEHYGRYWIDPKIIVPQNLAIPKVQGRLVLKLVLNGQAVSNNDYDLVFADSKSLNTERIAGKRIIVLDKQGSIIPALDYLKIKYTVAKSVTEALKVKSDVYLFAGLDSVNTTVVETQSLQQAVGGGAKIMLTGCGNLAHAIYPQYIRSVVNSSDEVTTMDIPESPVFDDIEPLDTRNFNNDQTELPAVLHNAFRINRSPNVDALASFTRIHGYLPGEMSARMARLDKIKGFPLVAIRDHNGRMLLSAMLFEKAVTDPVAGRLFVNCLNYLCLQ